MQYKPDLKQVVERHRLLWTRRLPDRILAAIEPEEAPLDPLGMWAAQAAPDLDAMFTIWEEGLGRRRELRDDAIPIGRVILGGQSWGGFLGAEVVFAEGGGWSKPLLTDWSQLESLRFDENNEWIQRQRHACHYFVERARGRFALGETEVYDTLYLADVLRGTTQALLDIYDHPQELRRLMAFGVGFNIRLLEMQRDIFGPAVYYQGGVFIQHCSWLPGQTVWLGVDTYSFCKPQVYADLGQGYQQQLIDHFGGGWLHLHALGVYLLPALVKLNRLMGVSIMDDPGQPRPFERLGEIQAITGNLPLEMWCHKDELLAGMRSRALPGGILYRVDQVKTVSEGNAIMEQVRAYRAPDQEE